jgi:AraC-like DNA-binding protein
MAVLYEKISLITDSSLIARWNKNQHFTYPLHIHDEYEIVYIVESFGTRYVGDSVESFQEGDLVLVGGKLPHTWQNNEVFVKNLSTHQVKAVVIQIGTDFYQIAAKFAELNHIKQLLEKSQRGVCFNRNVLPQCKDLLLSLPNLEGFEKFVNFLQLLNLLASTNEYRLLASNSYKKLDANNTIDRINDTLQYISANYQNSIKLSEIASQFHMSTTAFCNFFKRKTGKTVITYINEYRVAKSCKMLISSDKNVGEIAFECGFNNISNFNRTFKSIIGKSPRTYRVLWSKNSTRN